MRKSPEINSSELLQNDPNDPNDSNDQRGVSFKSWLALGISLGISVVLLVVLFGSLEWELFIQEFKRIRWSMVLALLVLFFVIFIIRTIRWMLLFPSDSKVSFVPAMEATFLGFFASLVLPLRAGEIVRPLALSRFQDVKFSVGFASIVNERIFDVLALFCFLGVCIAQMKNVPPLISAGVLMLGLVTLGLVVVVVAAYACPKGLIALADRILKPVLGTRAPSLYESLMGLVSGFVKGLKGINSLRDLLLVVFWSIVLWFTMGIFYQVGLLALGENTAPLIVGIMVTVCVALAVAAPSAPGFVGVFQLGCVLALTSIYSYSYEFAMAYAIVMHVIQALALAVVGPAILLRRGLTLNEVRQTA